MTTWAELLVKLAELRGLYVYAISVNGLSVVSGPFGSVSQETRDGNTAILNLVAKYLDRLGPTGDLGIGVAKGTITAAKWVQIANAQGEALNTVLQNLDDDSGRFWKEVVIQTGADLGAGVKAALPAAGFGAGLGVVLLLALYFFGGRR